MKTTSLPHVKRDSGLLVATKKTIDPALQFGCIKLKDKTILYGKVSEVLYAGKPFVSIQAGDDIRLINADDIALITTVSEARTRSMSLSRIKIVQAVCDYFQCPIERITSKSRDEERCIMRWLAFRLMRDAGHTLNSIGIEFNRDHGTVSWGLHSLQDRLETDPDVAKQFDELRARLSLSTSVNSVSSC